ANRWPALPDGRHEVILHSPVHDASFPVLGEDQAARVVELWSARTAALGSRDDVAYVFVFENRGRMIGSTIDHPHSQVMAFGTIPPIPEAELIASKCDLCQDPGHDLLVARCPGWQAAVPWAPSWPYELLISPLSHVADLPTARPARPQRDPAPRRRGVRGRRLLRSGRSAAGRGAATIPPHVNRPSDDAAPPDAARLFAERFGREPDGVWFAPGRVNLLGGPDYNEVFVLPFALGAGVFAAASRRSDRRIALTSRQAGGEPVLLDIDALEPGSAPGWAAYPAGVAW